MILMTLQFLRSSQRISLLGLSSINHLLSTFTFDSCFISYVLKVLTKTLLLWVPHILTLYPTNFRLVGRGRLHYSAALQKAWHRILDLSNNTSLNRICDSIFILECHCSKISVFGAIIVKLSSDGAEKQSGAHSAAKKWSFEEQQAIDNK